MSSPTNSKNTRVQPIFSWLQANGGSEWPTRLLQLANGLAHAPNCGPVKNVELNPELEVAPTPERLAWMIENANQLVPRDGKSWRALRQRVEDGDSVQKALMLLKSGSAHGVPRSLVLEGLTHADCLIECEHALVWIEGKRNDWLDPSTKWDVSRDQLARNLEAAWSLARASHNDNDYRLLICHEYPLKHHERCLIDGYRQGTWTGGWPHISDDQRREFAGRIGTLTWSAIADEWPALRRLSELHDLA